MSDFKVGDKVVLLSKTQKGMIAPFDVSTVTGIVSYGVSTDKSYCYMSDSSFITEKDFTKLCLEHIADKGIKVVYKRGTLSKEFEYKHVPVFSTLFNQDITDINEFISTLYPEQSPEQVEVTKIEQEMKILTERLAKLKEKL